MQERLNLYDQIEGNKLKSVLLVVLFVIIILALGWLFGQLTGFGTGGLIIAVFLAAFLPILSWYYSDKIVLSLSNARPAEKKEFPLLYNTVEGLCIAAGIPMPQIYVIDDKALNAFATGRDPQNAAVAVTTGLLEKANRQELEGVIAHELSHVKNYDVKYMTMVAVLVGVVTMLSDWILRSTFWGGRDRGGGRGGRAGMYLLLIGIALAILSPLIAQLIRLSVSRKREYLADADGALLSRNPGALASALRKIGGDEKPLAAANHATAHLFFSNPFRDKDWLGNLFSTHPPIEERIRRLEAMA